MLILILIGLTILFWTGYVMVYFWEEIYGWFDNRWGPPSRPEKTKMKRRFYD